MESKQNSIVMRKKKGYLKQICSTGKLATSTEKSFHLFKI